jgi:hypothetical protein
VCLVTAALEGAGKEKIFDNPANGFPVGLLSPAFARPRR